jgi:hypothetical protein
MLGIQLAIGNDQHIGTGTHGIFGISRQRSETRLDTFLAPGHRITNIQFEGTEFVRGVFLDIAQLFHVGAGQHRLSDLETDRRIDVVGVQQVRLRPDERDQRHDQLFADRVDRRIGHLSEQLLEVGVERLVL